jgi:hypothetical protein
MALVSIAKGEFILALIIMVSSISLLQIEYFTKVDAQEEETGFIFLTTLGGIWWNNQLVNWTRRTDTYT